MMCICLHCAFLTASSPTPHAQNTYRTIYYIVVTSNRSVFVGADKVTGEIVALKRINTEEEENGFPITAIREVKILKALNHDNIVQLKEIVTSKGEWCGASCRGRFFVMRRGELPLPPPGGSFSSCTSIDVSSLEAHSSTRPYHPRAFLSGITIISLSSRRNGVPHSLTISCFLLRQIRFGRHPQKRLHGL